MIEIQIWFDVSFNQHDQTIWHPLEKFLFVNNKILDTGLADGLSTISSMDFS